MQEELESWRDWNEVGKVKEEASSKEEITHIKRNDKVMRMIQVDIGSDKGE